MIIHAGCPVLVKANLRLFDQKWSEKQLKIILKVTATFLSNTCTVLEEKKKKKTYTEKYITYGGN